MLWDSYILIWDTLMNKCVNHQAQTECMVLLSLSNCASVHAPCTDVNSGVVAHISLALLIVSTVRRCIMKDYCIIYAVVVASYISVLCSVAVFTMWCMASLCTTHMIMTYCHTSQLPSLSPWSSKGLFRPAHPHV